MGYEWITPYYTLWLFNNAQAGWAVCPLDVSGVILGKTYHPLELGYIKWYIAYFKICYRINDFVWRTCGLLLTALACFSAGTFGDCWPTLTLATWHDLGKLTSTIFHRFSCPKASSNCLPCCPTFGMNIMNCLHHTKLSSVHTSFGTFHFHFNPLEILRTSPFHLHHPPSWPAFSHIFTSIF